VDKSVEEKWYLFITKFHKIKRKLARQESIYLTSS